LLLLISGNNRETHIKLRIAAFVFRRCLKSNVLIGSRSLSVLIQFGKAEVTFPGQTKIRASVSSANISYRSDWNFTPEMNSLTRSRNLPLSMKFKFLTQAMEMGEQTEMLNIVTEKSH